MAEDKKPRNPNAFPGGDGYNSGCGNHRNGMTLRDYFAAKALPHAQRSWWDGRAVDYEMASGDADNIAINSYLMADAMLKERQK